MREFLQQARDVELAPPPSVLDSPLKSLQQSLDALEQRRSVISQKVQEVSETLTRVKGIHHQVKAAYNSAMAHTSSVYPEVRPTTSRANIILETGTELNSINQTPSFLKSSLWKRDTRTGINSFGNSAWMRLRSSWTPLRLSGGTMERSSG